jgi:two-component system, chemotaxis family, sensor kinase CheA
MSVDLSQFYQVFFEESLEHLDNMESSLLELDAGNHDPELVHTIFRGAHSIKGGSGTFGFSEVAGFTHVLETLLDQLRNGQRQANGDLIRLFLDAVDVLREMFAGLRSGQPSGANPRAEALEGKFHALLQGEEKRATAETATETEAASSGYTIKFNPHRTLFRTGNDPWRILRELAGLGRLAVTVDSSAIPAFGAFDPEECYLAWRCELHGDISRNAIDEVFAWVEDECDLDITPLAPIRSAPAASAAGTPAAVATVEETAPTLHAYDDEPSAAVVAGALATASPAVNLPQPLSSAPAATEALPAAPPAAMANAQRKSNTAADGGSIRVGIEKIDALINIVGELVITQSMLGQVGSELEARDIPGLEALRDGLGQLERNTRELQEGVMRIRMLPISFAFSRFPRLVHDLSSKLGKQIELKLSGEQTELDKTVMEKIGDPLVHLVRNSIDHGIEMPEVRREKGKSPVGLVHLNAYHQGGNIIIEISDDGGGINREKVLKKARERGIIAADETPADDRILDLIFEPGFSTADVVTDLSGRGVGMDVVRRNIRDLGGSVEVKSRLGHGSTFTIRLPLTLAILDGQLVRVGNGIYVVPLVSIVESLQMRKERINAVASSLFVYRLRNDYIPIVPLYDLFGLQSTSARLEESLLVVVEGEGMKIGLVVDDLLSQQQVVIKSLETNFKPVPGISGATILGDGTVALILDTGSLVQVSRNRHAHSPAAYVAA